MVSRILMSLSIIDDIILKINNGHVADIVYDVYNLRKFLVGNRN